MVVCNIKVDSFSSGPEWTGTCTSCLTRACILEVHQARSVESEAVQVAHHVDRQMCAHFKNRALSGDVDFLYNMHPVVRCRFSLYSCTGSWSTILVTVQSSGSCQAAPHYPCTGAWTLNLARHPGPIPQVHIELEEERASKVRLQQTVTKLRHIALAQAGAAEGGTDREAARYNPYVGAYYRKAYADRDFEQYPPKVRSVSLSSERLRFLSVY